MRKPFRITASLLLISLIAQRSTAQTQGFQECHNVLYTLSGQNAGDQFGWVSSVVPDVDGDGIQEILTSAPFFGAGGSNLGRIYLYSGVDGSELFRSTGKFNGENLGIALAPAGDVDQDGIPDVLIGSPATAGVKGRARVLSGVDGSQIRFLAPGSVGDGCGTAVCSVGDVNADGWVDFALGAPLDDTNGVNAGRVYIVSGLDGSTVLMSIPGLAAGDLMGSSVGVLGDVTGDGLPELAVGAINGGPRNRGQVDLLDLQTGQTLYSKTPDSSGVNFSQFFLYDMGDVNADGWPDLYVCDFGAAAGAGKAYIYDGPSGALLWKLSGASGDGFGIGRPAGDLDADGHEDMLLASYSNGDGAPFAGKAEVFSGRTGQVLRTITSTTGGETLGFDAHGIDDLNADGRADYVLTAATFGNSRGRVYVIAGGAPVKNLGPGLAGSGALVPRLNLQGCPRPSNMITLQVSGALGGSSGSVFIGSSAVNAPGLGGTLYSFGDVLRIPHTSTGAAGAPGAGSFAHTLSIPMDPSLIGMEFILQVGYLDPGAPFGVSLSNGLRLEVY